MFGRGQHRVARHLGAGARRRRDRDARDRWLRQRLPLADDFEVVERVAGIGREGGNGLCRVDRASPTEADREVALCLTGCRSALPDSADGGLPGHAEGRDLKTVLPERGQQGRGAARCATGDDERTAP